MRERIKARLAARAEQEPSMRRAFVVFTFGRLGLFVLVAIILASAAGLTGGSFNGLPLLLVSLLVSSVLGLFLLRGQRDQFAAALARSREVKEQQIAARRARLDSSDGPAA